MSSFLSTVAHRSSSPIFLRSFVMILVVEAVTILTAWFLLDSNVSKWTASKAAQAVRISQKLPRARIGLSRQPFLRVSLRHYSISTAIS